MFNSNLLEVHNYHLVKVLNKQIHIWIYRFIPQNIPSHYRQFGVKISMNFSNC